MILTFMEVSILLMRRTSCKEGNSPPKRAIIQATGASMPAVGLIALQLCIFLGLWRDRMEPASFLPCFLFNLGIISREHLWGRMGAEPPWVRHPGWIHSRHPKVRRLSAVLNFLWQLPFKRNLCFMLSCLRGLPCPEFLWYGCYTRVCKQSWVILLGCTFPLVSE